MDHGRIPWFRPEELTDVQRQLYDRIVGGPRAQNVNSAAIVDEEGRMHGPFNAMLMDPPLGDAVQNLGAAIRYESSLTPRAKELATLSVAAMERSDYEWYAHTRLARVAGVTDDEIAAILAGREAATFSEQERSVIQLTRKLVEKSDLDDEEFAIAQKELGDVLLLDLIVLVGFYELLSRSLRIWRTPLPNGTKPQFH